MEGSTATMSPLLTVAAQASQLSVDQFSRWIDDRKEAVDGILEAVKHQVTGGNLEPLVGARIASCVAGSTFGYEEFHPRGDMPAAEQFLQSLDIQSRLTGAPSR